MRQPTSYILYDAHKLKSPMRNMDGSLQVQNNIDNIQLIIL